jgi:uncharacterized protein
MRPSETLAKRRDELLALSHARGALDVRVFGSVARGTDEVGSDVDMLVRLPVGTSLLKVISLQQEIAQLLGVPVDLCTEAELHPALRTRILGEARPL